MLREEDVQKWKGRQRLSKRRQLAAVVGHFGILAGCLYQCFSFLAIYFAYPTTVEISVVNEKVLDFPAVTVCNNNPVRYEIWCQDNPLLCRRHGSETIEEFRNRQRTEYDRLGRIRRIELGYSLSDFVVHAEFENETVTDNFIQYYDYEYTNCFTFNANWGDFNGSLRKAYVFNPVTGKSSELLICVNVDFSANQNLTALDFGRVQMTIHGNAIVSNPTYDAASLRPGYIFSYGIQKVVTRLLKRPYQTQCRNYEDEKEFRTGARMSQKNCLLECFMKQTKRICNCTYRRLSLMYNSVPCEREEQSFCLENEESRVFQLCSDLCPMACRKIEFYYVTTDVEPLEKLSHLYEKMIEDKVFTSYENMEENLACMRIHYGSTETRVLSHQPKYPFIELFSLLGGYTGLWLGFSLFNVHEYLLTVIINRVMAIRNSPSRKQKSWH